jgi:hypothetical protein
MGKSFDDESIDMFIRFGLDRDRGEFPSKISVSSLAGRIVDEYHRQGRMEDLLAALSASDVSGNDAIVKVLADVDETRGPQDGDAIGSKYHTALFVSGKRPFIDREGLREFAQEVPEGGGPRILLVSGRRPCGKTWTWHYLTFLESMTRAFTAAKVDFAHYKSPTALDVMEAIGSRLGLGTPTYDRTATGANQAKGLVSWFVGRIRQVNDTMERPPGYLVVLDSLDHRSLSEDTEDLVDGLVHAALDTGWELSFALVLMGAKLPAPIQGAGNLMRREDLDGFGPKHVRAYLAALSERTGIELCEEELAKAVGQSFEGAPSDARRRLEHVSEKVAEFAYTHFGPQVAEP